MMEELELCLPEGQITGAAFILETLDSNEMKIMLSSSQGREEYVKLYHAFAVLVYINNEEDRRFSFEMTADGWAINGEQKWCPAHLEESRPWFHEPTLKYTGSRKEGNNWLSVNVYEPITKIVYAVEDIDSADFKNDYPEDENEM